MAAIGNRQPYLELEAVQAWLGPRQVFHDLSLRLHEGEHTLVLGPNGAGKSALIQLISRELYPVVRPGSALRLFGSSTINLWDLRRRVGFVSSALEQRYRASVGTAAADVVLSGFFGSVGIGRLTAADRSQRQRVADLIEELHLTALADRPFAQLSDGERRRVLLARALVHIPEVLVLDEPTNGLDLRARHQLLADLRRLASSGTTLLVVTHQLEAVIPETSRVLLLRDGRLVGDGSPAELLQSAPLSALFDTPLQVLEQGGWRQVLPAPGPVGDAGLG